MPGIIAVHVGAGYHSKSLRPSYKKTCKNACISAVQKLRDGMNAVEVVAKAVSVLEDCPLTNAGIGSNLTLNGVVECDAGIMDGKNLNFGSVGALSNIKNPIKVAQKILEGQMTGLLPGGRIPPCTIVGPGAKDWALEQGFEFIDISNLSTKSSESTYVKNLSVLQNILSQKYDNSTFSSDTKEAESLDQNILLDTVGAVCVDMSGNVASAVSSGGLLLKYSGRIGQAAVHGSGCWAENSSELEKPSIACSVSGIGEYLIKTLFARECYQMVYCNPNSITAVPDVLKRKFLENPCLQSVASKLAGVLVLKHFAPEEYCEISWAHNTRTMVLGYMSTEDEKPISICSAQPAGASGKSIVGSERCIKLRCRS